MFQQATKYLKNKHAKITKSHEAVSTVHDEIIYCSEAKAKPDRSPQHLPSLPSVRMGKNLGTGMEFAFFTRSHLTSPASRGGGVTDESQAFPQVPAFQGFPHQPDATPSQTRKRKRKACMMPTYLKIEATLSSPAQAEGAARWPQHTR